MRRNLMRWKPLALTAGVVFFLGACSSLLDTQSLKSDGEPPVQKDTTVDGEPYDASLLPQTLPQYRRIALSSGEAVALNLLWEDQPGPTADADFLITLPGQSRPLFQIFSRGGQPYACSGLDVVQLTPALNYELNISSIRSADADSVHITLLSGNSPDTILKSAVSLPPTSLDHALNFFLGNKPASPRIQISPKSTFPSTLASR